MRLCWRELQNQGEFGFIFQMGDIITNFYTDENDPVEREELKLVRKETITGIMSTCRQRGSDKIDKQKDWS